MNRNSKHLRKPDGQNEARHVFDKDQPSEPAGGPNPDRYKPRPPRFATGEHNSVAKQRGSEESVPRETFAIERPRDQDATDAYDGQAHDAAPDRPFDRCVETALCLAPVPGRAAV